jgi:hypothetical protein
MNKAILALTLAGSVALAGCTTHEAIFGGAATGAVVGAVATRTVPGAIIGAGVGALAGAILVNRIPGGVCTYRYKGQLYQEPCR